MTDQRFRAEKGIWATGSNSTFESNVYINGSTLFIGQNLLISGNLVYSNTSIAGDLMPTVPEANLGNTTNRFALFTTDVSVNSSIIPTSNSVTLGDATNRFITYTANLNSSGTLTVSGNVAVNSTAFVVDSANKKASVNAAIGSATFTVGGTVSSGNTTITGFANVSGSISSAGITMGNSAFYSNTVTVTNTSPNVIDSWAVESGQAAKLTVFVDGSALGSPVIHAIEMLMIHDGTNVLITKYGEVYNTSLGTFDASIAAGNLNVYFTASAANTYYVKTNRQQFS